MRSMAPFNHATPLWFSLTQLKQMRRTVSSPTGTQPAAPSALRIPLPVSGQDCYRLFSTRVQVNSPYRIESALLQPFLNQDKKMLLVPSRVGRMWASLTALHQNYLVAAADRTERLLEEKNRIVLVVFPVAPDHAYVLQTRVSKLYVDRVVLEYQDPRYEPRRRIPGCAPLTIRLLPPDIRTALEQDQVHLTRELRWEASDPAALPEGHLTDLLTTLDAAQPSGPEAFSTLPSWSGSLRDISCGGICVSLPGVPPPAEAVIHRMLLLQIPLPLAPIDPAGDPVALTLHLLGVIRATRTVPPARMLHIQFLERLPEECDTLFKQLERGPSPQA
jgi:hypothetical protein